eukprot:g2659.t1
MRGSSEFGEEKMEGEGDPATTSSTGAPRQMGDFRGKWVSFDRLLSQVLNAERNFIVKWEAFRFICFMCIFAPFLLLHYNVPELYDVQETLSNHIVNAPIPETGRMLSEIQSVDHFWDYIERVYIPAVYSPIRNSSGTRFAVGSFNQVLWGVRFRQQRVRKVSGESQNACGLPLAIHESGIVDGNICSQSYTETTIDTTTYGMPGLRNSSLFRYTWMNAEQTGAGQHTSLAATGTRYGGDGFVVDLPLNRSEATEIVKNLKCKPASSSCVPFIDRQTRMVYITVNLFNVNSAIFARNNLQIEFDRSGKIIASATNQLGVLVPQAGSRYTAAMIMSIVLCVLIVSQLVQWLLAIRQVGTGIFDAIVALLCHALFLIHVYEAFNQLVFRYNENLLNEKLQDENTFYDLNQLLGWHETMSFVYAFDFIMLIMSTFKYMFLIPGLSAVFNTMLSSARDLIYFMFLIILMMSAFVFGGFIVFGWENANFNTLATSTITLFRVLINDMALDELVGNDASRGGSFSMAAVAFSIASNVLFYFVLTNLMIGILLNAWRDEKKKIALEEERRKKQRGNHPEERIMSKIAHFFAPCCRVRTYSRACKNPKQTSIRLWQGLRDIVRPSNIPILEVKLRLVQWRQKKSNKDIPYLDFNLISSMLEGGIRNQRVVTDSDVRVVMSLCIPPAHLDEKWLLTAEEVREVIRLKSAEEAESSDKSEAFNSTSIQLTEVKRLIEAVSMINANQQMYWTRIARKVSAIQADTLGATQKLDFLNSKLDDISPS